MNRRFVLHLAVLAPAYLFSVAQEDSPKVKDHPAIPRFPGTSISEGKEHDFGYYEFQLKGGKTQRIEGHSWEIQYAPKEGTRVPSPLELARNYGNQFKKNGGSVVFEEVSEGGGTVTLKMPTKQGETWMELAINNSGEQFTFHIITMAPMEQKVEFTADEMGKALATSGRIALHGILFDSNLATIKAESTATLEAIATLLKQNLALKVTIEGHTDNSGTPATNKTLSEKRARSVLAALQAAGIEANRLAAAGFGSEKPVADNGSAEGRAKNRRVELVKR